MERPAAAVALDPFGMPEGRGQAGGAAPRLRRSRRQIQVEKGFVIALLAFTALVLMAILVAGLPPWAIGGVAVLVVPLVVIFALAQ